MRFAYIDSQGNEVSIPSVDALALRIELGAINTDTQLYDEQADYWGPASTHEIFHTLSRDQGDEGLVAPPPMAPPPPTIPPKPVEEAPPEPPAPPPAEEPALEEPPEELPEEPVFQPLAEDPPEIKTLGPNDPLPVFDVSAEFDVSGEFDDDPADAVTAEPDGPAVDDLDLGFSGGGESLASTGAGEGLTDPGPFTSDPDWDTPDTSVSGFEATSMEDAPMSFGGGADTGAATPGVGGIGDSVWTDENEASDTLGGSDEIDLYPDSEPAQPPPTSRGATGVKVGDRPEPKDRPSAPRRPRQKTRLPALVGMLAVVGVGGYFGWQAMGGVSFPFPLGSGEVEPEGPMVVIPEIPAELMPTMREAADAAMADMISEFRAIERGLRLPRQPNDDWLAGIYLGTASEFDDVEAYWLAIEAFLDRVREVDAQVFHDRFAARAARAGVSDESVTMLVKRADSGFLAAREDRREAYRQLDNLVNAALDLHVFLTDHEDDITYEPAAGGMAVDPVLEASLSSESLGEEMWGMVDSITRALSALGVVERVTTERLVAALFDGIERAGVH